MSETATTVSGTDQGAALDPRLAAFRPDLADARLAGTVSADRFVEGVRHRVRAPSAPVRRRPSVTAPLDTELLAGEAVNVFDRDGEGWAWVQSAVDGYVGYAPADALVPADGPGATEPTHRVMAPATLLFPEPDIKAPPVGSLSMGAAVVAREAMEGGGRRFLRLADETLAVEIHFSRLPAEPARDWVAFAEALLGTPYLWGGKTRDGIDCSGLVQLARQAAGLSALRDSDMQAGGLGEALPVDLARPAGLRRGDLLFWRGHVAIVRDADTMLHANAHHMMTAIEPLSEGLARIRAAGHGLTGVRRP